MRTCVALLCCVLAMPALCAQSESTEQARTEQRLAHLRARIAEVAAQQRALDDRRGALVGELRAADARIAQLQRDLRDTEASLAVQARELERLEVEQRRLSAALTRQREELAALLRSSHALGRHQPLKLLLAQDQIAQTERVIAYYRYLEADRRARARSLIAQLRTLTDLEQKIAATRVELDATRRDQQQQLQALEAERAQRAALIRDLERRRRAAGSELARLNADEQALRALLARLRDALADVPDQLDDSKPFASRRGELQRPLRGRVRVAFGQRLPDGRPGEGWLIDGTAGAEVRAISHGRVAFADWMNGYGLILILDHGEGWMSLYANNDALLKNNGDWVRAGEVIATVGTSGGQGRPGLYFELRHDGQTVDPAAWFAR